MASGNVTQWGKGRREEKRSRKYSMNNTTASRPGNLTSNFPAKTQVFGLRDVVSQDVGFFAKYSD